MISVFVQMIFKATTVGTEQLQIPKWTRYYAYVYTFYMFVPPPESVMCPRSVKGLWVKTMTYI